MFSSLGTKDTGWGAEKWPYHGGEDGQEEGGGGCVAGALGESPHQQAQQQGDGERWDLLQWRQALPQPFGQSRGLVRDRGGQTDRQTTPSLYNMEEPV